MGRIKTAFTLVVLPLALASCALVMSFDDYVTEGKAGGGSSGPYRIRGTVVDGTMEPGTKVSIALHGRTPLLVEAGPFELPDPIPDGESFELDVSAPDHRCMATPANGVIKGQDEFVTVKCLPKGALLASLAVSKGEVSVPLAPPFDPGATFFRGVLPMLAPGTTTLVATTLSETAQLTIAGQPVTSGARVDVPSVGPISVVVKPAKGTEIASTVDLHASTYIKASTTRSAALLGRAIALSGDTLVVGAPGDTGGGAVYVFVRNGGVWSEQAHLSSSAPFVRSFGASVAISGDTLVVGAPETGQREPPPGEPDFGIACVFTRSGTVWSQQAELHASNQRTNAKFGSSVAVSGDTVVVGAAGESSGATGINGNQADKTKGFAGAVYAFTRSGTAWSQQAYVKASNAQTQAVFGTSVSLSDDTLAVGAPGENSGATGVNGNQADTSAVKAGAAYLFTRAAGAWSQKAYVKASDTTPNANFGRTVSVSNDTLVVSADGESTNGGAVYVYGLADNAWSHQADVKAPNASPDSFFGSSTALAGDLLAVGDPRERSNAKDVNGSQADTSLVGAGAAYLFKRNGSSWSALAYVKASNTHENALFGSSVALGTDTLVVGSQGESSNATGTFGDELNSELANSGAVYAYPF